VTISRQQSAPKNGTNQEKEIKISLAFLKQSKLFIRLSNDPTLLFELFAPAEPEPDPSDNDLNDDDSERTLEVRRMPVLIVLEDPFDFDAFMRAVNYVSGGF
jgi:hypothetical protein